MRNPLTNTPFMWNALEDQFYYIGRTSDGTEVQIGNVGSEDNIERYLADHPTPEDW